MERVLNVEWKRTPLRRIVKEVLNRLAGELTVDEWSQYAAEGAGRTYRAIFDEIGTNTFALRLQLEGGEADEMDRYVQEMEMSILKGGGLVR